MADKTQFRTIETDEEELNTKIRKHRLKIIKIILLLLALALSLIHISEPTRP